VRQEVPAFRSPDQATDSRLPFGPVLFGRWQLRDVVGSILQGDEILAAGQRDGILKPGGPGQSEPSKEQERQNFLL
jgi:hypothetical protein